MANQNASVIYAGMTNNIIKRVWQHKNKYDKKSFTAQYNVTKLVYYEIYNEPLLAISREKQIKSWARNKKLELIKSKNPNFVDLYEKVLE